MAVTHILAIFLLVVGCSASTGPAGGGPGPRCDPSADGGAVVASAPPPTNPRCLQASIDQAPPATTRYVYPRQRVTPFYQWQNNIGYCGETTIIQGGMTNGQWLSQFNARLLCGGQGNGQDAARGVALSQSGPDGYCTSHDNNPDFNAQVWLEDQASESAAGCLENARLAYRTYDYKTGNVGVAGYRNYMSWVKRELIAGHQVVIGVDVQDADPNPQFEHIVTVMALGTNHDANDASYYDDDVLYFDDHGADQGRYPAIPPGAGGTAGCAGYVYGYTFADLGMTLDQFKASQQMYAVIIPGAPSVTSYVGGDGLNPGPAEPAHNYGYSILGPADSDGFLLPVTLRIASSTTNGVANPVDPMVGLNYENPFIGTATDGSGCTNVAPKPMSITLEATVSGLTPGVAYTLYEYDFDSISGIGAAAALRVPTSSFNAQAGMATSATHFVASSTTYVKTIATSSRTVVVFRAVPDCAP